ncbi:hypothetical protein ACOSP7_020075 [Xanthoceras sorbifolium]
MEGKLWCLLLFILTVRWVSATSRMPFHGHVVVVHQSSGQLSPQPLPPVTSPPNLEKKLINEEEEEERKGLLMRSKKIGSSPPSCEHKCYGCIPCEAIQVPTTTTNTTNTKKHTHFALHYANYEPEGWKCKCGPSFYTP